MAKKTKKHKKIQALIRQAIEQHNHPISSLYPNSHLTRSQTAENSLSIAAVWACVRLLAQTISTLPIKIYHRGDNGKQPVAYDHYLHQLFNVSPNHKQTPVQLIEFIVASLLLRGNAYLKKTYIGNRLVALTPILPQNVERIEQLNNGTWQYTFSTYFDGIQRRETLPEHQIWHLSGFGIDGLVGLNPLLVGADILGTAKSAETVAGQTFDNGLNTSGVFNYKNGFLTKEQRSKFKTELREFIGSKNSGKLLLLENGVEYQAISMNPETAQLLGSREYSAKEICRFWGVPPVLIGLDAGSGWGNRVEDLFTVFTVTTIRPILVNIEQSARKNLISTAEREHISMEFKIEGLLRGDTAARTEQYQSFAANGIMSRNEIRAKENLPPIDGGDTLTVQAAMIPLADVGKNFKV